MKRTINIPHAALKAAVLFSSLTAKNNVEQLACVHVEANATETRLMASNGHVGLAQIYKVANEGVTHDVVLLPARQLAAHIDEADEDFKLVITTTDAGTEYALLSEWGAESFGIVEGQYPDLPACFPEFVTGQVTQFDPAYLELLTKAAALLDTTRAQGDAPRMLVGHNGTNAALVSFGNDEKAVGILMGVSGNVTPSGAPAWVKASMVPEDKEPPQFAHHQFEKTEPVPEKKKRTRAKKVVQDAPAAKPVPDDNNCDDLV